MYKDSKGRTWYKGNLHMHTTASDGLKSPEATARLYQKAGYDFISLTDHWVYGHSYLPGEFHGIDMLILSGIEYDTGKTAVEGIFHILGIGMSGDRPPSAARGWYAQEIIDDINHCDGLAVLAHPSWSLNTPEHVLPLRGISAIEIFNSVSDLPHNCRPYSGALVDMLACKGVLYKCLATDDTHFYSGEETRSWIMVDSDELTSVSLIKAIREGRIYATQGPHFEIELVKAREKTQLRVSCPSESEVDSVVFFSDTVWAKDRAVCRYDSYGTHRRPNSPFQNKASTERPSASLTSGLQSSPSQSSPSQSSPSQPPDPQPSPLSLQPSVPPNPPIAEAIYTIKPTDTFIRVEVTDSLGRQGWSSPYKVN